MKKKIIELKINDIIWFLDTDGSITEFKVSSITITSKYFNVCVGNNDCPFKIPISCKNDTFYSILEEVNYLIPGIYLNKEDLVKILLQGSEIGTNVIKNIEKSLCKLGETSIRQLLHIYNFLDNYSSGPKNITKLNKNE